MIFAGGILPPKANPREFALQALNNVLGGQASSRLNLNLREDKHWSYGAFSLVFDARGERPLLAYWPICWPARHMRSIATWPRGTTCGLPAGKTLRSSSRARCA